jgi:hypothetical protein
LQLAAAAKHYAVISIAIGQGQVVVMLNLYTLLQPVAQLLL